MNTKKIQFPVFIFLALITLAGCSQKLFPPKILSQEYDSDLRIVKFKENIIVPDSFQLRDPDDPEELVKFAILLFQHGRYNRAKEYFLEASRKFHSKNMKWEQSTYAGAMLSTLYSGDAEEFARMEKFFEENLLEPGHRIKPKKEYASLIALGRFARNELNEFPIGTPQAIKTLLEEKY